MHTRAKLLAFALLATAVAFPFAAKSASFQVGITIVEGCEARVGVHTPTDGNNPLEAKCSSDRPYSVAIDDRPVPGDGRSGPAIVPDEGSAVTPAGFQIATFTL